jgi:hypothetical protein
LKNDAGGIAMKVAVCAGFVLALAAVPVAWSQGRIDRAFTATGLDCDQVTWSAEAVAKYPQIASACRRVVERDGKYYVNFTGEVVRAARDGSEIVVDFKGGDRLTLNPPAGYTLQIDGRSQPISRLERGDVLNFYIPEDQLAGSFFAGDDPAGAMEDATAASSADAAGAAMAAGSIAPDAASDAAAATDAMAAADASTVADATAAGEAESAVGAEAAAALAAASASASGSDAATQAALARERADNRRGLLWLTFLVLAGMIVALGAWALSSERRWRSLPGESARR